MNIRLKSFALTACFFAAALFSACSDDSGNNSSKPNQESSGMTDLELPDGNAVVCDDDMEGVVAITVDEGYRKCVDGEWVKITENDALNADKIIGQIDNITSSGSEESSGNKPMDYSAEKYEDIPSCTAKREGSTVLVETTGKKYVCESGEWLALQSTVKSSSSAMDHGSSSSVNQSSNSVNQSSDSVKPSSSSNNQSSSSDLPVAEESSSSKGNPSALYKCDDGRLVAYEENCISQSSSSVIESSDSVDPISSSVESSSSNVNPASSAAQLDGDIKADGYYKTNCPAGKTCTYLSTEHLNPNIAYGEFLDTRDYQVYKTVTIGSQTWMAQNLNYAYTGVKFNYGSYADTSDSTSWCRGNKADSCLIYGRLYTWAAAIDSVALANDEEDPQDCGYGSNCSRAKTSNLAQKTIQGVCPDGWHLPNVSEWYTLLSFESEDTGVISTIGTRLKTADGWRDDEGESGNGTNAYGFSALPAGVRYYYREFSPIGFYANFWSASQYTAAYSFDYSKAFYAKISFQTSATDTEIGEKFTGFSVRCIKNSNNEGGETIASSSSANIVPEPVAEIKASGYYKTNCPAGKTCKYAPTEHLNPNITYGEILDTRDYQVYKTVTIGSQTWMAQNLNYADFIATPSLTDHCWCYFLSADSCAVYGRLYTWAVAIDSVALAKEGHTCGRGTKCERLSYENLKSNPIRGLCPNGWHLPSNHEWAVLFKSDAISDSHEGTRLRATSRWVSDGDFYGPYGTDTYGFAALPAGYSYLHDSFTGIRLLTRFWTARDAGSDKGEETDYIALDHKGKVEAMYQEKFHGSSVRCIKDSN